MENVRFTEPYTIYYYNNDMDVEVPIINGLDPSVAKSIARHYNKKCGKNECYYAEEEPRRYW